MRAKVILAVIAVIVLCAVSFVGGIYFMVFNGGEVPTFLYHAAPPAAAATAGVQGKLVQLTNDSITIRRPDNTTAQFAIDARTSFLQMPPTPQSVPISALVPGITVTINQTLQGNTAQQVYYQVGSSSIVQ